MSTLTKLDNLGLETAKLRGALAGSDPEETPSPPGSNHPPEHRVVLMDVSSSMGLRDVLNRPGRQQITRLERLEQAREEFRNENQAAFSCEVGPVSANEELEAYGGTNLTGALRWCAARGYRHVIVITDGQPNSESAALGAATALDRVDVVYAGPQPEPPFCRRLAGGARGYSLNVTQTASAKELGQSVRGLLGPGREA